MTRGDPTPAAWLSGGVDVVREPWRRRFFGSPLRFRAERGEAFFPLGEPVALRLIEAVTEPSASPEEAAERIVRLTPGAGACREVEKTVAFVGAQAVAVGAAGYDVAALLLTLRDTLTARAGESERRGLADFFEWLVIVAVDAYASAAKASALERAQGELERGTPVVLLPGEVPAAFLLGSPPAAALESIFGRLILLAARVGARAVVVDGAGLRDPEAPAVREAVASLFDHGELSRRATFFVSGLSEDAGEAWRALAREKGLSLRLAPAAQEAALAALEATGYELTSGSRG